MAAKSHCIYVFQIRISKSVIRDGLVAVMLLRDVLVAVLLLRVGLVGVLLLCVGLVRERGLIKVI